MQRNPVLKRLVDGAADMTQVKHWLPFERGLRLGLVFTYMVTHNPLYLQFVGVQQMCAHKYMDIKHIQLKTYEPPRGP